MSETTIPLEQATADQLRHFATTVLGLPLPANAGRDAILSKIRTAGHTGPIPLAPPQTPVTPTAKPDAAAIEEEMVTILIDKQEEVGGDQPVPVRVNGVAMYIPRGEPCRVKRRYVEALRNAVKEVYEQVRPEDPITSRQVPAYPWRILHAA